VSTSMSARTSASGRRRTGVSGMSPGSTEAEKAADEIVSVCGAFMHRGMRSAGARGQFFVRAPAPGGVA
jgi:hypothetical protein